VRYKDLGELRDAYARGDVTEPLMIDNDMTSVMNPDENDPEWQLFEMHPAELAEQALDLLGIPHEDV
jgi:hypothetical protein